MKIKIQVILFLILDVLSLNAQLPNRGCATPAPGSQYDSLFQQKVIDFLNTNSAANRVQTNYQIPFIIHVIHGGEAMGTFPNITQGQINSQITVLGQSIKLNATGNSVFYYWLPDSLSGATQTVQILTPTTYAVCGQGTNGCFFSSTFFVDVQAGNAVIPVATPSAVCIGDSAILSVAGGYVPLRNINPVQNTEIVAPLVFTSYTVSAMDQNGCVSDIVFNVDINSNCGIIIYNGFTPNGDGTNGFFTIDNIDKFPNNKVTIYNRWGNKVFSTSGDNNQNNKWDEKLNGIVVTSGTYI